MARTGETTVTKKQGDAPKQTYRRAFRPMKPKPHPRQADIDAAQPPMRTMTGHGTGYTRSPGGKEGT